MQALVGVFRGLAALRCDDPDITRQLLIILDGLPSEASAFTKIIDQKHMAMLALAIANLNLSCELSARSSPLPLLPSLLTLVPACGRLCLGLFLLVRACLCPSLLVSLLACLLACVLACLRPCLLGSF